MPPALPVPGCPLPPQDGSVADGGSPRPGLRPAPRSILKQPSPLGPMPRLLQRSPSSSPQQEQQKRQLPQQTQRAQQAQHEEPGPAPMDLCPASPAEQPPAEEPGAGAQGSGCEAQGGGSGGGSGGGGGSGAGVAPGAPAQPAEADGDAETPGEKGDGPLELTPDAAVELTPGPAPSRGMKMLASAGAGAGAGPGGWGTPRGSRPTPARIALAFPAPPPAVQQQQQQQQQQQPPVLQPVALACGANSAAASEGAVAAGRPLLAAGSTDGAATPVGAAGPRRQPKASRGARLLQALQAGGHRGGSSGSVGGCSSVRGGNTAADSGAAAPGPGRPCEQAGCRATSSEEDVWAGVLASPL